MAKIQEYGAQTDVGGPQITREAKESDTGNIGDAVHGLGKQISKTENQIQERAAESEVSDLTAKMAQRHADMTQSLDEALAQPGAEDDPQFAQKFMDKYDERMSDLSNGTHSPQAAHYMEKANAMMRSQFQISAFHGQAHLAGEQAVQNMNTTIDSLSTSVITNPSTADNARDMADLAIDHLPSNIPERTKDQIRANAYSSIAMGEVQGWVKNGNPESALDRLKKGEWDDDLSGQQKLALEGLAEHGIQGKRIEAERQQKLKDAAASAQMETESQRLLAKMYTDPKGLSTNDVVGNPKLDFDRQKLMLGMIEQDGGKNFKSDPATITMLMDKIHPLDGSPGVQDENFLYPYFGKPDTSNTYGPILRPGGVSQTDFDWLRREVVGKKTQAGADEIELRNNYLNKYVRSQLVKSTPFGLPDQDGEAHYASYLATFFPAYERLKQAGKTPQQLLNPQSPDYIGNTVNPETYKRTQQEIIQSMYPKNPAASSPPSETPGSPSGAAQPPATTAPAPPREPHRAGESPAAYLKRIKGG